MRGVDARVQPPAPRRSEQSTGPARLLPGLLACVALAALATLAQELAEDADVAITGGVFVAIVLGAIWRNTLPVPDALAPGIAFAAKQMLKMAIVLLGLRFSLGAVAETGLSAVLAILAVIAVAFVTVGLLGRLLSVPPRLALLIGVGTAICGNSAIAAAAPILRAEEEEVAFASATITLFGTIAVVVFPLLGAAFGMTDGQFGLAAGAGVHDSAQAVASGFLFSAAAGGIATVVKLTRTAFLVPLLLVLSLAPLPGLRPQRAERARLRTAIPGFALGFLALSGTRTLLDLLAGATPWWLGVLDVAEWLAAFLVVVAMAGIGLTTSIDRMRSIGLKPFYAGLVTAVAVAATALGFAAAG